MHNEYVASALARERQQSLIDEAAAARAAREARRVAGRRERAGQPVRRRPGWSASLWSPAAWRAFFNAVTPRSRAAGRNGPSGTVTATSAAGEAVALRDGSSILVRPVQPTDGELLLDGFARLSARSRYTRFLSAKAELTPAEVHFFTHVDHHHHDALCAVDPVTGRGVGIARFVRSRTDGQEAEVAITVVDEWQRRGIGTALLMRLATRALQVGIFSFTAVVATDNRAMIGLLRNGHAGVELTSLAGDVLEYEVALASFTAQLRAIVDTHSVTDAA